MTARLNGACCEYTLGATLGVGEYGKAIRCTRDADGSQVVVKQVHISSLSPEEQAEAINEVRIMQELDHLNVVKYIECIKQHGCLYIVMEYCCYGELSGLIANRAKAQKPFTEQEIMFWFVQVALGLWHVHSKNILHRDLKTQNIFITKGGILKLGDFGISRILNSDTELAKTAIGTPYYLSPEICQDLPYNRKSDVWALGCVLYELATLRRAFTGGSLPALVVKILKGQYPPLPARYSNNLGMLVDSLLQQDPRMRPSIDAVLRMEYVKHHLARYAQHVVRITTQQPAQEPSMSGQSPHGLCQSSSASAAADVPGSVVAADAGSEQRTPGSATVAGPSLGAEGTTNAEAATSKAATGGLRVPLPGFLRKRVSGKQQSQQAAHATATTATTEIGLKQDKQQCRSIGSRIVRRLSSSGGSSNSDSGGFKGLLKRRNSSRSDVQESSNDVQTIAGAQPLSHNSTEIPRQCDDLHLNVNNSNPQEQSTCHTTQPASSFSSLTDCNTSQQQQTAASPHSVQEHVAQEEDDYPCSTSSSESPSSASDSTGQKQCRQRKKLIGTGWIEQQQLALARLQADLDASPLVRGRGSNPQQQQQQSVGATPGTLTPGRQAAATPVTLGVNQSAQGHLRTAAVGTKASPATAVKPFSNKQPSTTQKPKRQVGCSSSSKGGAAVSPADVVAAARAARLAERAGWQQQKAAAAADDAARRAARSAQLAAALQDKAAAAHKAEEAGAAAMSAHRQHMRAVQPRVQKSQLAELGAAFRQRIEAQVEAAEAGGTDQQPDAGACQQPDASAVLPGVRILQKSSGGQAMLLDLSHGRAEHEGDATGLPMQSRAMNTKSGGSTTVKRSPQRSDKLQAGTRSGGSSHNTSRRGSCSSTRTSSAASSKRTTPERERRQQLTRVQSAGRATASKHQAAANKSAASAPAPAPEEKPWKASKFAGLRRSMEPAVEIYAPFGSDLATDTEQQSLEALQELTFGRDMSTLPLESQSHDSECRSSSPQVANVLHQIQAALTVLTAQDEEDNSPAVPNQNMKSFELPPEAPGDADQLPAASVRGGRPGSCLHGTAALPLAERIDALRSSLEESLGEDAFMLAYRYMTAMHNPSAGGDDDSEASYEVLLFELLGPEKVHLVHQIHKLVMLENQAYGSC